MSESDRVIAPEDLLPPEEYERLRGTLLVANRARKNKRRIGLGPHATFFFENWHTMFAQIQEMIRVEKGGRDQLEDELAAYNPMIPNGRELTATVMFEVEDEIERGIFLGRLGGVENHIYIEVAGVRIAALPEDDVERSTPQGKASAVQFLHFPFDADQIEQFGTDGASITIGIDHESYCHSAELSQEQRQELLADFADL